MTDEGEISVLVQNNRLRYEFDVKRNITVIKGDNATGKTTLYNMIALAARHGDSSGVEVRCRKNCCTLEGPDWKLVLPTLHDNIIFLDEDNRFLKTKDFARMVRESDNYFVIITREDLANLPYSVEEIYGIHMAGKYHDMKRVYNEFYHIYGKETLDGEVKPDAVLVEDSNAGYDFFRNVCREHNISCESAGGKSKIKDMLKNMEQRKKLVIADGASIGPEMNELSQYMGMHPDTRCYLPESFEWLILKSGLVDGKEIEDILRHPQDYIESREYFSWERFFTDILIQYTEGTYLNYNKRRLNDVYLHEKMKDAILKVMERIKFE